MSIKLFVGLGNPGDKYKNTRHNFGFIVLDAIARAKGLEFKSRDNMADISFFSDLNKGKIYLLKPTTFMNDSGLAISSFANYYKISPEEIFVFYDDFSINLSEYRVRLSGSSAGHNGLKSIIKCLNSDKFPRMKLGIGPLPQFMPIIDFVLSNFKDEEKEIVACAAQKAVLFFEEACALGLDKAVSRLK